MPIPIDYVLYLSLVIVAIGLYGVFTRRSMIRILIGTELILQAAIMNLVAFSMNSQPYDPAGQVLALIAIAVASAETIIGLILLILLYRKVGSIDVSLAAHLKGIEEENTAEG